MKFDAKPPTFGKGCSFLSNHTAPAQNNKVNGSKKSKNNIIFSLTLRDAVRFYPIIAGSTLKINIIFHCPTCRKACHCVCEERSRKQSRTSNLKLFRPTYSPHPAYSCLPPLHIFVSFLYHCVPII